MSPRKVLVWLGLASLFLCGQTAPFRYSESPVIVIPNIDGVICGDTTVTHYWKFADSPTSSTPGPAPTQLGDSASGCASALPSPVPLNASTPTASPWPIIGDPGMVADGTTSAELTNGVGALQGQFFTIAGSGLFSTACNANAGGSCTADFSLECIVDPSGLTATTSYFFDADGTASGFGLGLNASTGPVINLNGTAVTSFAESSSAVPYVIAYSYAASGQVSTLYVNGVQAETIASPAPQASVNSITYFGSKTGAAGGWNGRLEKCALRNVQMTPAIARSDYLSTGLP